MKRLSNFTIFLFLLACISGCVPTINKEPANVTVSAGQTATFSVEASVSGPGSLSYQWQRKDPGTGKSFYNLTGATQPSYTTGKVSFSADNEAQYKCAVKNGSDIIESTPATLSVDTFITQNPSSCIVADGAAASFSVIADGTGFTYKWFRAESGTNDFKAISENAGQSTYTFTADYMKDSGAMFRCEVTLGGLTKTTTAAVLTVSPNPIAIQTDLSESNIVANGAEKKFEVIVSSGTDVKYQWYRAEATDINNFLPIAGAVDSSYTINANYGTDNGARFFCRLHNITGDLDSKKATLTVTVDQIAISGQPANQSLPSGQTATFTINVSGYDPSYKWTISYHNGTTEDVVTSGNILNIPDINYSKYNDAKVKCTVSNVAGSVTSNEAILTVIPVLYVNCLVTGGAGDGSSWENAYSYLQLAFTRARSDSTIKEIWVAAGTYKPTSDSNRTISFNMIEGVALYGGFSGNETCRESRNYTVNVTTLSGDIGTTLLSDGSNKDTAIADDTYHVVVGANNSTIDGFLITGGCAVQEDTAYLGGGMYNINCSPTVANCTFAWNKAWYNGGGIYNENGSPLIKNCNFSNNMSYNGSGISSFSSSPSVTNCEFTGNTGNYGAIYNSDSTPMISNCTFKDNLVQNNGGAIYNRNSSGTLQNCIFTGNNSDFYGGALANVTTSSPIVKDCSFINNSASEGGGAIFNGHDSSPTISNCILTGNIGGGIYDLDASSPVVTNCKISVNTGIGMYNALGCSPIVTNSTFSGNVYYEGAGIYNTSNCSPIIRNCIIWGNTLNGQDFVNQIFNDASTPILSNDDIQMNTSDIYPGEGNINADPLFQRNPDVVADPKDPGDLRLQKGSPCIDTGSNSALPYDILYDLSGLPRISDGIVDMGAYEYKTVLASNLAAALVLSAF